MKKDRNCSMPYPMYPPYGVMPGIPNMGVPQNMPIQGYSISDNTLEQQLNNIEQRINNLENRVSALENKNYNNNYQML